LTDEIEEYEKPNVLAERPTNAIGINNLVVSSAPQKDFVIGDVASLVRISQNDQPTAIFWNEDEIDIALASKNELVRFVPELEPATSVFFQRAEGKNRRDNEGYMVQSWGGEYEPLQFKKTDFLKWIKLYADQIPEDLIANVKSLRIKATLNTSEDMLGDDEDIERRTEDISQTTNVPKRFSLELPVTGGVQAALDFECEIVRLNDRYGNPTTKRGVQLRCINARQVKKDMMQGIIDQLPAELPRYYGRIVREHRNNAQWW